LGVGSDERAAKANSLNGSDQNRFLDRVARAFKVAENRQGVVKLRLHPPELGALRIELRMQNGALNARLEAESAVTQSLLLEHAYALRDRLSEQGVRIARFDVELSDRRSMEHPNGFDERSHRDREPARNHRQEEPAAKSEATPLRPTTPAAPGNINVII
jgi:flagellar hook-length control protein FliK